MSGPAIKARQATNGCHWNEVALSLSEKPGDWYFVLVGASVGAASYPAQRLRALGCDVEWKQQDNQVTLRARWPK